MWKPIACATAMLLAPATPSQDLRSGPPAGRELGPLRVAAVDGPRKGEEFDAAAAMRKGPAAILFVHEVTRNVAPMIRAFDEQCSDFTVLGLRGCIVRLDDDRTEAERHMPLVSRSLRLLEPITVSVDGAEGPGSYALNRKATLTLVLAVDGVVVESMAFTDTGRQDAPVLRMALESIAGALPEQPGDLEALLARRGPEELAALVVRLQQQRTRLQEQLEELQQRIAGRGMQGGTRDRGRPERPARDRDADGDRPMRGQEPAAGAAPSDAVLSRCAQVIVRGDVTAEQLDQAFRAVDERIAAEPALRTQAVAMFERMLSRPDYGGESARKRAQTWLDRNRR